jgi:hypothetical protein
MNNKLASKHMRKFLHVLLRGLQIFFWIQYYDESSVFFAPNLIPFDDNLPKVLEYPNNGGLLVNRGQQFWRYLVSSSKLGSTTHVYISSCKKSYFGVIHEGLKFGSITPCLLVICDLTLLEVHTRFPILHG